jgi:MFS family permease
MGQHARRYAVVRQRWLILLVGFLINCSLWTVALPFAASSAAGYLCVAVSGIHWISYAFLFSAILGAFPGLWLIQHLGLRKALTIAVSALVLGVSMRCLAFASDDVASRPRSRCSMSAYIWIISGTCLAALGTVPIQASTTMISATWFSHKERGLANTLVRFTFEMHVNVFQYVR